MNLLLTWPRDSDWKRVPHFATPCQLQYRRLLSGAVTLWPERAKANDTRISTKLARLSAAQAGRPGPPGIVKPLSSNGATSTAYRRRSIRIQPLQAALVFQQRHFSLGIR